IEDVFTIEGRGTVTTGRVERGKLKRNEEIEIVGIHPNSTKTVVTGIEMFHKDMDECQAGDNVGALLRGVKREDVVRGQVLAKPASIKPHTHFKAQVYVLNKDEGGRHTPFLTGYRPQFYMRTTDVTGEVKLPEGVEMTMPGDNVVMDITLGEPIGMDQGLRFAIREGGKTVGAGVVTARRTNARTAGPIPLPTEISKLTVIRSPFIDKDSREQFEMRTHKRIVDILDPNPRVVDALMRLSLPAGVSIEIKS